METEEGTVELIGGPCDGERAPGYLPRVTVTWRDETYVYKRRDGRLTWEGKA